MSSKINSQRNEGGRPVLKRNPFSRFFSRSLSQALSDSIKRGQLDRQTFAYRFFEYWFRQDGSCFFFLCLNSWRLCDASPRRLRSQRGERDFSLLTLMHKNLDKHL